MEKFWPLPTDDVVEDEEDLNALRARVVEMHNKNFPGIKLK